MNSGFWLSHQTRHAPDSYSAGNLSSLFPAMTVRQALVRVHRWIGLTTGLVVTVVCLTGAIFVWEQELFALGNRALVYVEPGSARLPADSLHRLASSAIPADRPLRRMVIPTDPRRAVVFTAQRVDDAASTYFSEMKYFDEVYVDPYTARVLGVVDRRLEPLYLTRMVHENLLLGDRGTHVVGIVTVIFVAMTVVGLVLWWPRTRKVLRGRLRPRLTGPWKRSVYDTHNVLGFYLFSGMLILAVTGPVWTWTWWTNGIVWTLTGEARLIAQPVPAPSPAAPVLHVTQPMESALRATRQLVPDARRYMIEIPSSPARILTVGAVFDRSSLWEEYERYYYHPQTAELLGDERFEEKNLGMKWRNSNYGIHTGTLFGWPSQVLACAVSLFAASLPVTGFLIWFPRWRRQRAATAGSRSA